jgi:hypothetical protein
MQQWTKEIQRIEGIKCSEARVLGGGFVYFLARASLEPPCLTTFNSHNTL